MACIVVGVGDGKNLAAVVDRLKDLPFVESWEVQDDGGAVFVKLVPYSWFSEDPASTWSVPGLKACLKAGIGKFGSFIGASWANN